jgi:type IV secretory pathway VirB2 component (pilin)
LAYNRPMTAASSLFDAPASPVFAAAGEWVTGTLLGSVAVSLCVIAIAFVGLRMMTGHLAARDGLRVVIACFVLLGASTIAAGVRRAADQAAHPAASDPLLTAEPELSGGP